MAIRSDAVSAFLGRQFSDLTPLGKNTITSLSAAVTLGSGGSIPAAAKFAMMTVEGQQIRYWVDGSVPTSSQGHLANVGDTIFFENGYEVSNAQIIQVASGASVQITFKG